MAPLANHFVPSERRRIRPLRSYPVHASRFVLFRKRVSVPMTTANDAIPRVPGSGTTAVPTLNVPAPCAVKSATEPPPVLKLEMPEKLSDRAASTKLNPGTVKETESVGTDALRPAEPPLVPPENAPFGPENVAIRKAGLPGRF